MYKISITKIEEKEVNKREYEVVGEKKDESGEPKNEYGYVNVPNMEEVETAVYSQLKEEIDLKKVIDAFNN